MTGSYQKSNCNQQNYYAYSKIPTATTNATIIAVNKPIYKLLPLTFDIDVLVGVADQVIEEEVLPVGAIGDETQVAQGLLWRPDLTLVLRQQVT